jgi:N-acylneuraminate cytidylyltransferase
MFRIDGEGFLRPLLETEHEEPYLLRRQDLPPVYHYDCVLDVTRPQTILEKGSMTGSHMLPLLLPEAEVLDVDTPLDLELAELALARLES